MSNTVLKIDEQPNGFYTDLSNDEYHKSEGISKSGLDLVSVDPSYYEWDKNAPVDNEKLKTLDFGTDFHAYFLEPEKFAETYKVLPTFNRRKADEKQAELDLIEDWKKKGFVSVTAEEFKKLKLMRDSAMAHPTVAEIMALNGEAELSGYWIDPDTGELCRCRPDYLAQGILKKPSWMNPDAETLVADVKTTADINNIPKSVENFRYFVQDAFYTDGVSAITNTKVDFIFIFVSTTANCGKYPVRVVRLADTARFDGRQEYKSNLIDYSNHKKNNHWSLVEETDRPHWAINNGDIL